jgi:hypothetical protein
MIDTPMSGQELREFGEFITSRNLMLDKANSRSDYIIQRDASALRRHDTALQVDYPETWEKFNGK